ncbi:hypothetical protein RO3G_14043 [Rhizopus delemar RA 99-880]|uniref:Uncharacterized protein n=1 Tax=Rhizopus delemar (strain RA 99-880 / ATCC MYA-4621 / FGSC 9543 / NRRL 43880) TaxID=246409 RepID=I1CLK2_RHIO9|nr:hypothetical protein RO3G_14043 [Rhizopus delemar RA 99-880]|eukprot:EIE89332.1 hypothetical protein RO3G_14043 [Rhizopus delemar RA 99-880]
MFQEEREKEQMQEEKESDITNFLVRLISILRNTLDKFLNGAERGPSRDHDGNLELSGIDLYPQR